MANKRFTEEIKAFESRLNDVFTEERALDRQMIENKMIADLRMNFVNTVSDIERIGYNGINDDQIIKIRKLISAYSAEAPNGKWAPVS